MGEDGNLNDMNSFSIAEKIGFASTATTTFQISEPQVHKKPSTCCAWTALGIFLLLLTASQGLLMYKVFKMQREILKFQQHNTSYTEEILKGSFANSLILERSSAQYMRHEENWRRSLEEEITIIKNSNANLKMMVNNITLVAGRKGEPGPPGQKGEAGVPGQTGPVGNPGLEGRPGQKGAKGDQGPKGSPGIAGSDGLRGQKGDQGIIGAPGQKGEKGDQGPSGIKGLPGQKGSKGDYGIQGPKGEPGLKGAKGERGFSGSSGSKGSKGEKGEAGISGFIRIVGGRRGRVEILHQGRWGTICDDGWTVREAGVVCRMLGFSRAVSAFTATAGTGDIWLDDVTCSGSETSIFDCRKSNWGTHNCGHSEDAGVECI